ncbi:MAG: amino acid permease [Phycisphaerae bacterium]|nr:amino acid permease [Phycisphaerae bacterium]
MRRDLPRSIGFWGGSAIMVGIIIGSGIFRTPASIASEMDSPALILALWLVGGILSLFGAFTYAELGTMFPRSGGIYVFMYEGLGEVVAFIFGWTYVFLGKPLAAASIATVFSEHLNRLLGVHWDIRFTTCTLLVVLTAINTVKVQLGAGVAIFFTGLKVIALLAIIALGLRMAGDHYGHLGPAPASKSVLAALAPVLAAVLWTYDGWSDIASCAGEIRDPQRLLPRILVFGTAATVVIYLGVNAVYMMMVPLEEMRHTAAVAPLTVQRLIGRSGDVIVTVLVLISTLGAVHASIIAGARVTFAQARDGLFFKFLGHIHPTYHTPDVSLWAQCLMSAISAVAVGTFERMIGGFVFAMWIFFALAAAAVIILRIRRPALPRPYKCWGYPWVPIVFILSTAFMTVLAVLARPGETLVWLVILAAGVPAFFLWRHFVPRVEHPDYGRMSGGCPCPVDEKGVPQ